MCKQKDLIPMNCDVFLAKGNSSRPENINIAGSIKILQNLAILKLKHKINGENKRI